MFFEATEATKSIESVSVSRYVPPRLSTMYSKIVKMSRPPAVIKAAAGANCHCPGYSTTQVGCSNLVLPEKTSSCLALFFPYSYLFNSAKIPYSELDVNRLKRFHIGLKDPWLARGVKLAELSCFCKVVARVSAAKQH